MRSADSVFVWFLALGIVACATVATYAWRNPHTRGRRLLALGSCSASVWMLGDLIGRFGTTFAAQYASEVVRYVGIVQVPVWVLAFTRAYCGVAIRPRMLVPLFVVPAASLAVMATSVWHQWFFRSMVVSPEGLVTTFGPYFWYVHLPYSYLLTALGVALLLHQMGRVPQQFRRQIQFLFVALCVPFAINVADMAGLLGHNDNTVFGFPVFALLMSIGIYRHRLLNVNPIAYERVFQDMHDGVIILSRDDTIVDINGVAARQTGKPRAQLIGAPFRDAFAHSRELVARIRDRREIVDEFTEVGDDVPSHYTVRTSNVTGSDAQFEGRIVTLRDVTVLKRYQESLEILAYYDPLTRVANRRRFEEEVGKALQRATRHEERFAILYFDLNQFKAVNDTLGHAAGDELLTCVGARAASLLRAPDFVARLGGDEFVVLLHHATPDELPVVVARLLGHVEQPVELQGRSLTPKLSVGAACYPRDGGTLHTLLRHADGAMYRAKARGGGFAV